MDFGRLRRHHRDLRGDPDGAANEPLGVRGVRARVTARGARPGRGGFDLPASFCALPLPHAARWLVGQRWGLVAPWRLPHADRALALVRAWPGVLPHPGRGVAVWAVLALPGCVGRDDRPAAGAVSRLHCCPFLRRCGDVVGAEPCHEILVALADPPPLAVVDRAVLLLDARALLQSAERGRAALLIVVREVGDLQAVQRVERGEPREIAIRGEESAQRRANLPMLPVAVPSADRRDDHAPVGRAGAAAARAFRSARAS